MWYPHHSHPAPQCIDLIIFLNSEIKNHNRNIIYYNTAAATLVSERNRGEACV